jgi:hypothetical protein
MPQKKIKQELSKFRAVFFREKYRFDQGNAFLVLVNFALLVTTLVNQYEGNTTFIKYYIALGFFGTWFLGYILDRVVKIQDIQERISLERSPIWQEAFQYHSRHEKRLEKLTAKLEKLESRFEKNIEESEEKKQEE